MKNNSPSNVQYNTELNARTTKLNLQECKHGSLLHGRGVELQDEMAGHINHAKLGAMGVKIRKPKIKFTTRLRKVNKTAEFLAIFDEEKELKSRFIARHI